MTRDEAEREVIRRWRLLPDDLRLSYDAAEAYSCRLAEELDFYTVTSRQRLIGAWLIREVVRDRAAEREAVPAPRTSEAA